jgi:hypothetical protein
MASIMPSNRVTFVFCCCKLASRVRYGIDKIDDALTRLLSVSPKHPCLEKWHVDHEAEGIANQNDENAAH